MVLLTRRIAVLAACFSAALLMGLFLPILGSAYADDAIVVYDSAGTVIRTESIDSSTAINQKFRACLREGKGVDEDGAPKYEQTTVELPSGTYLLDDSIGIRIYSNTVLKLQPDTALVLAEKDGIIVEGSHLVEGTGNICFSEPTCEHGGNTQFSNIVITGGIWDMNCAVNSTWNTGGFLLQHGDNIRISDMTVKNYTNHAINVAGCTNVYVTNVIFENHVRYTGTAERFWGTTDPNGKGAVNRIRFTESIHTDYCQKGAESTAYPLDGSACENVYVSKCKFLNTYAGVGTHHDATAHNMKNINVTDCTFELKDGNAVNLYGCTSATVKNNTLTGGYSLVRCDQATATIENNTVRKTTGNAIAGVSNSQMTIGKNTISTSSGAGVLVGDSSSATITSNVICNASDGTGINISKGMGTAKGNAVTGGSIGIAVKSPKGACVIDSNTVKGVSGNGIYVCNATLGSTVCYNRVSGCKAASLRVDKSERVALVGNTATGAKFAVSLSASSNVNIKSNKVCCSSTCIRVVDKCKKVTVAKNTLKGSGKCCKSNAIYFYNGCTGTISGNTVVKAGAAGIRIDKGCKVKVKKNKISKSASWGISVSRSSAKLSGNKIKGSGRGAVNKG